jgi:small GTP-binding protein
MNVKIFKIILIGDSFTGKSTIFECFYNNKYNLDDNYKSTIGVDFKVKHLTINSTEIKLQLWDTAGQERFKSIISSFYRGVDCILFCYDITNIESFKNIPIWVKDVNITKDSRKVLKVLIGNKTDDEINRKITYNMGLEYAMSESMEFFEISAKQYKNDDILLEITTKLLENYTIKTSKIQEKTFQPIVLENKPKYKLPFSDFC